MLRRHIFLLRLNKSKLPFITIPLRIQLHPLPRLLLQPRLRFSRRRQHSVRRLSSRRWRNRATNTSSPRRCQRRSSAGSRRSNCSVVVPHLRSGVVPHRSVRS
ncbi:hypothetical protein HanXRQr2_Chr04g0142631 [Helianthus annuus]|uniref:Uncharacterized protein n=1 Tax=Helianthus annuus TaxID=4232 RepID=A0A9K3J3I5_HELAN|nr:hypothetical protein HanXRQr2_Chr04g0142631 [Helianthus annuus]